MEWFSRALRLLLASMFSLFGAGASGHTGNLWTIYWMTAPYPCGEGWGTPAVSTLPNYAPCPISAGVRVSICPGQIPVAPNHPEPPYDLHQPILVTGWQWTHVLSDANADGYMVVGTAKPGGADIFASAGGHGTYTASKNLSTPLSIDGQGDLNYIDVYTTCTGSGTQRLLLVIEYTTP